MPVPCYLTNRDLLTPVRGMVRDLQLCDDVGLITIIDCGSTYPPLLEWYAKECPVRVVLESNLGNRASWRYVDKEVVAPFYFASDADIDLEDVPRDFLTLLCSGLTDHPDRIKAGLSLQIFDLPHEQPQSERIEAWESKYWMDRIDERWFSADVDTAAAVYRRGTGWGGYGPSLRAAPPYTARHLPWYLVDPFPEEYRWYLQRINPIGLGWAPRLAAQIPKDAINA